MKIFLLIFKHIKIFVNEIVDRVGNILKMIYNLFFDVKNYKFRQPLKCRISITLNHFSNIIVKKDLPFRVPCRNHILCRACSQWQVVRTSTAGWCQQPRRQFLYVPHGRRFGSGPSFLLEVCLCNPYNAPEKEKKIISNF